MVDLKSFREELNTRISIVDYISKKVPMKPKGKDWWGCCPFHKEKTPSFSVNEAKGFYHCFGCGAHGDLVQFEIEMSKCSFMEAIRTLANYAGVAMPELHPKNPDDEKKALKYLSIMETSSRFYSKALYLPIGRAALKYLLDRGLSHEIIRQFRLGYAPADNSITKMFIRESEQTMYESQLVRKSEKFGRNYDFFRNRLMFPICDSAGRVISFSGRFIPDANVNSVNTSKYINLPETDFFKKRRTLYCLNMAKQSIRKKDRVIIVEGQIDTIMLHHAGFSEAVATLGTAFTKEHFMLLSKFTKNLIFCFDGDDAGHNAAYKTAMIILPFISSEYKISIIVLSNKQDPDDVIKASGPAGFEFLLNRALPLFDYLWGYSIAKHNINKPEERAECEKELMLYANMLTDDVLKKSLKQSYKAKLYDAWRNAPKKKDLQKPLPQAYNTDEKMLVAILFKFPSLVDEYVEFLSEINMSVPELNNLFIQAKSGKTYDVIPLIIGNELKMITKSSFDDAKKFIELVKLKCQKKKLEHELSLLAEKMMINNSDDLKKQYDIIVKEIDNIQRKILDI